MGQPVAPSRAGTVAAVVIAAVTVAAGVFVLRPSPATTVLTDRPVGTLTQSDIAGLYDPVRAGEALPEGFRQLIPRDGIRPVYEPEYVAGTSSPWDADTLVVGVVIDGDARAFPVDFLNHREMVIDSVAGIPVLVTW